ncbi:MAG TPA: DUF1343 domain-containing protein [Limnochordia bacterium]|nr:DUF1343 domain-containing protein [Limnochordia bacterium]
MPLHAAVRPGIDVLLDSRLDLVQGRRVGLVTNHAGVDQKCRSTVDLLWTHPGVRLAALFGPEHGLRGNAQAGVTVSDSVDERTGLPVYSLYGSTKKPSPDSISSLDALILDLPDVGCRYWTILYTMSYVLEAAAEAQIPVIVLDRPNPITGLHPEGNLVEEGFFSFVGGHPIPNRTAMTIGEAALLFNDAFGIGAELHVVTAQGWRRGMWWDETGLPWVPPSPNMPTPQTALLYPGTCLFEGTNLSEGRGTTTPFELIGAPWIDPYRLADALNERELPGVRFRPAFFTPTFSKHRDALCAGVHVHVLERDRVQPVRVGLHLLDAARRQAPSDFAWLSPARPGGRYFIDLLAGTDRLRRDIDQGRDPDEIWNEWNTALKDFLPVRERYLLYPEDANARSPARPPASHKPGGEPT